MIVLINTILSHAAGLFEALTCIFLLRTLLGAKHERKIIFFAAAILEYLGLLTVVQFVGNIFVNSLFYFTYYWLFALLFCHGKLYKKLLVVIACLVLLMMSDVISMAMIKILFGIDISVTLGPANLYNLLGIALSKTFCFSAYAIVVRLSDRGEEKLSARDWIPLVSVPLTSILTMLLIIDYIQKMGDKIVNVSLIFVAILSSFLINILVFFFYKRLEDNMKAQQKLSLMRQQAELQSRHYAEIESTHAATHAIWHDMNNHMTVLSALVQKGDTEQMRCYLEEIGKTIHELKLPCHTGNTVLDALINEKYRRARQLGIEMELYLCPITEQVINPMDLCIIVGNALDNAIEACQKVGKDAFIHVRIKRVGETLSIVVHNSVPSDVQQETEFKTTKKDKASHGFGIRNIKKTLEKHDGSFHLGLEDNVIKFSAFIPSEK